MNSLLLPDKKMLNIKEESLKRW